MPTPSTRRRLRLPFLCCLLAAVLACGDDAVAGPRTYLVSIRLDLNSTITADSLLIRSSAGPIVHHDSMGDGWTVYFGGSSGSPLEATFWGTATGPGQALISTSASAGSYSQADSAVGTAVGPGPIQVHLTLRYLP